MAREPRFAALGEDPAASRSRARKTPTFREFAERYLAEQAVAKLKPGTVVNYKIYLRKHAFPSIGGIKLDVISEVDIVKLHHRIGETRPMTANRVVECISSVYRYAAACGLVARGQNPAAHIEAFREQFLTPGIVRAATSHWFGRRTGCMRNWQTRSARD